MHRKNGLGLIVRSSLQPKCSDIIPPLAERRQIKVNPSGIVLDWFFLLLLFCGDQPGKFQGPGQTATQVGHHSSRVDRTHPFDKKGVCGSLSTCIVRSNFLVRPGPIISPVEFVFRLEKVGWAPKTLFIPMDCPLKKISSPTAKVPTHTISIGVN